MPWQWSWRSVISPRSGRTISIRIFIVAPLVVLSLCACAPPAASTQTPSPVVTAVPTTVPTQTDTPEPTSTPPFYASDIPISATAASCAVPPLKRCLSGLNVRLSGRQLSQYTVTVSSPGFSDATFACPEKFALVGFGQYSVPVDCDSSGLTFVSFGLQNITLKITWESGTSSQTFEPVYEPYAINGPQCDPICSVATLEMKIP